jgi:transposase InsO family protein
MDTIMRGLPFVTTYMDDVLIHSSSEEIHSSHLEQVLHRLQKAGLTLRGNKCQIGLPEVAFLGHVFSGAGVMPDKAKVKTVEEWPTPNTAKEVQQFLGLASYYRRFVSRFADIAAPLHYLTQKDVQFCWTKECNESFQCLKRSLTEAPILAFPHFDLHASPFILQTDASAGGLGAILQQDGHVIAYASRVLNKAECNYSVIQRECLAAVYGMKQFRHYLLGRPFELWTDHEPLKWLANQKLEGMLGRWALALQEYSFTVVYRRGSQNTNADALSRRRETGMATLPTAVTRADMQTPLSDILAAQKQDQVIKLVAQALKLSSHPATIDWRKPSLRRYSQLWAQLLLKDGIVWRHYTPGPTSDAVTVPVLPAALQKEALQQCHDSPQAGHQGAQKTLYRLRRMAYWVNMAQDVECHCRECTVCQQTKPTMPMRVQMTNVPIGRPWQMIAMDILEVPVSSNNNRYLLVVQDYFTKWADARPLPDQTASRITTELVDLFTTYGVPEIVHSDQGRNFESAIFQQVLKAFGVKKTRTTAYHPQGDGMVERFNCTLL